MPKCIGAALSLQWRVAVAFAANRVVCIISPDLDLITRVYRFFIFIDAQIHRRLLVAEPANRLHLLDFIRIDQHVAATLEQLVLEVIFQSEAHDGNVQLIHDTR